MEHTLRDKRLCEIQQTCQRLLEVLPTDTEMEQLGEIICDVDRTLIRLEMENQILQARYDKMKAATNPSGAPFVGPPAFPPSNRRANTDGSE